MLSRLIERNMRVNGLVELMLGKGKEPKYGQTAQYIRGGGPITKQMGLVDSYTLTEMCMMAPGAMTKPMVSALLST